jgi:hypothetical protein
MLMQLVAECGGITATKADGATADRLDETLF